MGLPSNFRRLRLAIGISNLGDGIRLTALPLLATRLTSDPRLIAGVAIADRVPWLVFILDCPWVVAPYVQTPPDDVRDAFRRRGIVIDASELESV